jgi:hypothetical protein
MFDASGERFRFNFLDWIGGYASEGAGLTINVVAFLEEIITALQPEKTSSNGENVFWEDSAALSPSVRLPKFAASFPDGTFTHCRPPSTTGWMKTPPERPRTTKPHFTAGCDSITPAIAHRSPKGVPDNPTEPPFPRREWIDFNRLCEFHRGFGERRQQFLHLIKNHAQMVSPSRPLHVAKDPDDDKFLECADAARADYLVTGNQRHFPKFWKKTKVITSREFISIVAPHLIP